MKKSVFLLFLLGWNCLGTFAQGSNLESFLEKYRLSELPRQSFARTALSAKDCEALAPYLVETWKQEVYDRLSQDGELSVIRRGNLQMAFADKEFGEVPLDGHCLFISLHGGGAVPKAVNDEQWQNQIGLYQPEEGIYLAPRAPWDDWNMWFKPGLDEFLEDLIQWMVVTREVNPNRVYLLGYSAGGDGVWRMAPRMADRWAAASMMAGHPGEAEQVNLINVPFMIWMGEKDAAYHRNVEARKKGLVMDSLEQGEPLTYVHETHIVRGKGHWMDGVDAEAVRWMPNFERDALPVHIVWRQEEVVRPWMYWLEVDPRSARQGMRVDVIRNENEIEILHCDYAKLRIYLNDDMMDLNQNVRVVMGGKVLYDGRLKRTLGTMARTLSERGDYNWMFSTFVEVTIK